MRRPEAAGIILDASALRAAHTNLYLQTLVREHARERRPIVVPASCLVLAVADGRISAAELDPPQFTVTALSQPIVPAVALLVATSSGQVSVDIAHVAYEHTLTGNTVLTGDPDAYQTLPVPVDVEPI